MRAYNVDEIDGRSVSVVVTVSTILAFFGHLIILMRELMGLLVTDQIKKQIV